MNQIKYPLFVFTLTAAILLETFPTVAQTFRPPNRGAPSITAGGGSRSGSCVASNQKKLTALLPSTNLGLTVSDRPTFFGYVPKSDAKAGEFILMDRNNQLILRERFTPPAQSGIVSITLPASSPSLEVGKTYQWYLVLVCNPDDRSDNAVSGGWIERIQPNRTLAARLKNATPETLPALYADAGIWHEAFANLVTLRRQQPTNSTLATNWERMLNSAGLQAFIQEPLVD